MPAGQNVNMRIPDELLDSIDSNATRAGQTRTAYVLSWLPDTYQRASSKAEAEQDSTTQGRR